jgi:flavin reductase (DIM6/NTAB) family NADH-FMN oxidoreductase RutF
VSVGEPSPRVDVTEFRRVVAHYATGVCVVSAVRNGVRYGMTVNSFTSVSLDPVLVLFCCEHDATLHAPLLAAGSWAVSVLRGEQEPLGREFAVRGRPGLDRFASTASTAGRCTGAPLVADALAWLECRTWATYDGGDHTIVVGEVLSMTSAADGEPLVYFRSRYRRVATG